MSKKLELFWVSLILLLAIAVVYWINLGTPPASTGKASGARPLLVEAVTLSRQEKQITIPSYGTLQALQQTELHALVSGQVIELSPLFKAGKYVKKGDVLLQLDKAEYEIAVQEALSNVSDARLALAEEQARFDQTQREWSKTPESRPENEYALRKPQIAAAKVRLDTALAALEFARLNLARTSVRAGFDGRISAIHAQLGTYVTPATLLAEGYETSAAELRLPVAAQDYAFLPEVDGKNAGQVSVALANTLVSPAEIWDATLVRSEASVDQGSQQVFVVARIDDPFALAQSSMKRPLKIGQYLEASIQGKQVRDALSIPNKAIYQGRFVYVLEDEQVRRKDIKVLWRDQDNSLVASGLQEGELLIVTALGNVSSGTLAKRKIDVEKQP